MAILNVTYRKGRGYYCHGYQVACSEGEGVLPRYSFAVRVERKSFPDAQAVSFGDVVMARDRSPGSPFRLHPVSVAGFKFEDSPRSLTRLADRYGHWFKIL